MSNQDDGTGYVPKSQAASVAAGSVSKLPQEVVEMICDFMSRMSCPCRDMVDSPGFEHHRHHNPRLLAQARFISPAFRYGAERLLFSSLLVGCNPASRQRIRSVSKSRFAAFVREVEITNRKWGPPQERMKKIDLNTVPPMQDLQHWTAELSKEVAKDLSRFHNLRTMILGNRVDSGLRDPYAEASFWLAIMERYHLPKLRNLEINSAPLAQTITNRLQQAGSGTTHQILRRNLSQLEVVVFQSWHCPPESQYQKVYADHLGDWNNTSSLLSKVKTMDLNYFHTDQNRFRRSLPPLIASSYPTFSLIGSPRLPQIGTSLTQLSLSTAILGIDDLKCMLANCRTSLQKLFIKEIRIKNGNASELFSHLATQCSAIIEFLFTDLRHADKPGSYVIYAAPSEERLGCFRFTDNELQAFRSLYKHVDQNRISQGLGTRYYPFVRFGAAKPCYLPKTDTLAQAYGTGPFVAVKRDS